MRSKMSSDLSELDDMAEDWGGVLDPSVLAEGFADILSELVDSANLMVGGLRKHMSAQWATRPLHVAFTNSKLVNAVATKGKVADYLLITIGAVGRVYGTMNGFLSTPNFLPEIGNATGEETPNELLTDGFPPMPLLEPNDDGEPGEFYLPADQARTTFAMQLSSAALHFLLYHEIGHIVAGHLELREHQGVEAAISEFAVAAPRDHRTPPLSVLECDADAFAAHTASFVDLHPNSDKLWKEVFGWDRVPGKDAGFIAHAVAISIFFRMLGTDDFAPESVDPTSHPHPTVRSCLAISRTMSLAAAAGRFDMADFPRLCRESVLHVEDTWAALGLPGQRIGTSSNWAEQVGRLSTELLGECELWKTELCKFARVPRRWDKSWPSA